MTNEETVERTYKDAFHLAAFLEDMKRNEYVTQQNVVPTEKERTGRYSSVEKNDYSLKDFLCMYGQLKMSVLERHVDFGLWSVPVFNVTLSGSEKEIVRFLEQAKSFSEDYSHRLIDSLDKMKSIESA